MKRLLAVLSALLLVGSAISPVLAQDADARVRVVHASPDAPAVDVWVNDSVAFSNAPFKGITDYAGLEPATYNVKVVPTGATEPVVIEADLGLDAGTDYTVVALNTLNNIEPLVLVDNNSQPAAGKAHVRFVHASPDAPAVDIAVADGGPVLFSNVAFKEVGDYLPVDAGTYDLEVRVAGTEGMALDVPGLTLNDGTVYTVFAMGLADGEPALTAVPSVDASYGTVMLPESGGMPNTTYIALLGSIGLALVGSGLMLRRKAVRIKK